MADFQFRAIIVHPEFEALKAEIEKLRTEISMLVLERDHLIYQECKNIEMAYMLAIGALEYRAYETECLALRLKRKMDLIQAAKNRQAKINLPQIEAALDAEFVQYQEHLAEQLGKMTAAIERNQGRSLSESETLELRKLYRGVVKELHPDLHPDVSGEKLRLFHLAVEAYERADLEGMRAIHIMVANPLIPDQQSNGFTFLKTEKERLAETLKHLKSAIDDIKSSFPYTMKTLVQSPERIEARKSELNERIASLNDVVSAYSRRIDGMLR